MTFTFSARSYRNLRGVRPELIAVATLALTRSEIDFVVTEGLRTLQRQMDLVKEGASRTLDSRHLTGHAIDVAALVGGQVTWDWPAFERIALAFKSAAADLGIALVWGGDWTGFRDGPHFELHRKPFPAPRPTAAGTAADPGDPPDDTAGPSRS